MTAVQQDSAASARLARTGRADVTLTGLAALAATVSAVGALWWPSTLRGAAVTDGNLRGTALVVLVVAVPLLLAACRRAQQGSAMAVGVWLAALLYLAYQGVMFCFGTPMNRFFPAYVALLGLAGWAAAALLRRAPVPAPGWRSLPRDIPLVLGATAALNALAWLARALPVTWTGTPPASVTESGLQTSPVLVQDLALWLPLALVVAVLAWRGRPWAVWLAPVLILFYAVEALGVAADQWWGYRADSSHPAVAAIGATPVGLVVAAALAAYWWWTMRRLTSS